MDPAIMQLLLGAQMRSRGIAPDKPPNAEESEESEESSEEDSDDSEEDSEEDSDEDSDEDSEESSEEDSDEDSEESSEESSEEESEEEVTIEVPQVASRAAKTKGRERSTAVAKPGKPGKVEEPAGLAGLAEPAETESTHGLLEPLESAIASGNKKALATAIERYPLPIVLDQLHHMMLRSFRDGVNPVASFVEKYNGKYNIVSEFFAKIFAKGSAKQIESAMRTYTDTVDKLRTDTSDKFIRKLLKYFTAEFIAMHVIRHGSVERYDSLVKDTPLTRSFHTAKGQIAAYYGAKAFFSNKKRYTFSRDIMVAALAGGHSDTVEYLTQKFPHHAPTADVIAEAKAYSFSAGAEKC